MSKNEIHARLTPETMEQIKQWTSFRELPNISATVRWLIDTALKSINNEPEAQQKNDDTVRLIEEECKVFFARCRDEYDPPDGNLYWFWFESESDNSWVFDPDSPNNWCPVRRFNSREEAIRDYLREKVSQVTTIALGLLPALSSATPESNDVIDW